ncbi:MAG: nucleotidyl transferase AbiEii/AbiGii toxin family protein [Planctomycetes bacterium]|nr:nucleotidyl transferase AbiEii/AbiGii toxin family protein [Planctomycetota bacterium]
MLPETILTALEAASRALSESGARYALIGGAALPAWGRTRATADADILVGLGGSAEQGASAQAAVVGALRAAGFAHLEKADRRRIEDKVVLHFWFPLREQGYSIRLDVIAAGGPEYEEILSRASPRKVNGFSVPVASCEDLVLLKLAAGRLIDRVDVQELLAINKDSLDRTYLETRAARRNLAKELEEAWKQA